MSSNTTRQINRKKFTKEINTEIPSLTQESRAAATWTHGEYFRCFCILVIFPTDPAVSLQSQQVLAWMGFVLPIVASFMFYLQPFCIKLHDHMLKYAFTQLLYTWGVAE